MRGKAVLREDTVVSGNSASRKAMEQELGIHDRGQGFGDPRTHLPDEELVPGLSRWIWDALLHISSRLSHVRILVHTFSFAYLQPLIHYITPYKCLIASINDIIRSSCKRRSGT